MSEFQTGILPPHDLHYRSPEHISWLEQIEEQLLSTKRELRQNSSQHDVKNQSESLAVKELFVLATLLYVEKKSKQLFGSSNKTDEWIDEAFLILKKIEYCNKPWPLFIFSVEARTESRRMLILEVIDRSIGKATVGGLVVLRELVLKIWVQDDLNTEASEDYKRNLCSLLLVCDFVLCLL